MHLALFLVFGAVCVAGAVNLLIQTHPIQSALSLIVVTASVAGSMTTVVSFVVIIMALTSIAAIQRRRARGARRATLISTE